MKGKKPTREQLIALAKSDPEAIADLVLMLWDRVDALEVKVAQLERNSRTSSKPPSSDSLNFTNKPKPKSRRTKSGLKPGGQKGHKGTTLEQVEEPDEIVEHRLGDGAACKACGAPLGCADAREEGKGSCECRQVFELPAIRLEVTEHRAEIRICSACGTKNTAGFPDGVGSPVQYGDGVRSTALYLNAFQLIPFHRLAELFGDIFDCQLSAGTLANFVKRGGAEAGLAMVPVREALVKSAVAHADETGCRIGGKRQWLHVLSTPLLTSFHIDPKRGLEGMDRPGLLGRFTGKLVHDFLSSYYRLTGCEHYLCGAHLLRELTYLHEEMGQPWAEDMIGLLMEAKELREREDLREEGQRHVIGKATRTRIRRRYDEIVLAGKAINPEPVRPPGEPKKRGRVKRGKPLNMLIRLGARYEEIMGFFELSGVPFDNNLSERDLRMMKVREKISGTFRSTTHPEAFADIRSVISTARKQSYNILDSLKQLFKNPVRIGLSLASQKPPE